MYQLSNLHQLLLICLSQTSGEIGNGGEELLITFFFDNISRINM
jgi:hypothetical protein